MRWAKENHKCCNRKFAIFHHGYMPNFTFPAEMNGVVNSLQNFVSGYFWSQAGPLHWFIFNFIIVRFSESRGTETAKGKLKKIEKRRKKCYNLENIN